MIRSGGNSKVFRHSKLINNKRKRSKEQKVFHESKLISRYSYYSRKMKTKINFHGYLPNLHTQFDGWAKWSSWPLKNEEVVETSPSSNV